MEKPKYLYHGSSKELIGGFLVPKNPIDLGDRPDNLHKGVYASDIKESSCAMAIISCKGVKGASLKESGNTFAIIYEGYPEQDYFYLYTLDSATFENRPKGSHQWVSFEQVKPIKIERLVVKDFIHLIRMATEEEKKEFYNRYGGKINKLQREKH